MSRGADIISFSDRAKQSLATAQANGTGEARLSHLERISSQAVSAAPATDGTIAKATDIQFPLRSIPKWVPTGD
jgi:hypothetical protein